MSRTTSLLIVLVLSVLAAGILLGSAAAQAEPGDPDHPVAPAAAVVYDGVTVDGVTAEAVASVMVAATDVEVVARQIDAYRPDDPGAVAELDAVACVVLVGGPAADHPNVPTIVSMTDADVVPAIGADRHETAQVAGTVLVECLAGNMPR